MSDDDDEEKVTRAPCSRCDVVKVAITVRATHHDDWLDLCGDCLLELHKKLVDS